SSTFTFPSAFNKASDGSGEHTLYIYSQSASGTERIRFFDFKVDSEYQMPQGAGGTCESCHGVDSTLIGGDHVTEYTGTPHDTALNDDSGDGYPAVLPAGSPTRCTRCHLNAMTNGGDGNPISPRYLRVTGANTDAQEPSDPDGIYDPAGVLHTVLGNDNTLCFACHEGGAGAFSGKNLFAQTKHSQNSGFASDVASSRWRDKSYGQGVCGNCHNPHGVEGTTDYTLASNNNLCYGCHDSATAPAKPSSHAYQGKDTFEAIEHGSTSNTYNKWPNPNDTGAAIGTGGNDSGECINCHNPHGKDDGTGNLIYKLTMAKEEMLCYGGGSACHTETTASENGIDLEEIFNYPNDFTDQDSFLSSRHNIVDSEQTDADPNTAGDQPSKVECDDCHNPHINGRDNKVADPDSKGELVPTRDDPLYGKAIIEASTLTQGETRNKQNVADTYLKTYWGGGGFNYGTSDMMWLGKLYGELYRPLLKFDLSSVPSNALITKATLNLDIVNSEPWGAENTGIAVTAHKVTSSWDENTVTWDTMPSFDTASAATQIVFGYTYYPHPPNDKSADLQWTSDDLTTLVTGWHAGTTANNGLLLKSDQAEGDTLPARAFASSENFSVYTFKEAIWPRLIVEYTTAPIPTQVADDATFCVKCHDGDPPEGVTIPAITRPVQLAFWVRDDALNVATFNNSGTGGDLHGAKDWVSAYDTKVIGPYYEGIKLTCSTCHDPHSSTNVFHLRESINGVDNISIKTIPGNQNDPATDAGMRKFCWACHVPGVSAHYSNIGCIKCHYHGAENDSGQWSEFTHF
ncbi:MAG: DNRLRE domain-containing protein, partial [Actinobacteria bacterium]